MNFFQAQEKAKRNTLYLFTIFLIGLIVFVLVITIFVILSFAGMVSDDNEFFSVLAQLSNTQMPFVVACFALVTVIVGIIYQSFTLKDGGKAVAEELGAKLLDNEVANLKERVLTNVVEEMAISSGVPIPSIYVLEDTTINAFVAGYSIDDTIVCVTRGALDKLERQELQGVIAHEFSHIFNGDTKLYMKTTSLIAGIIAIAMIGGWILKVFLPKNPGKDIRIVFYFFVFFAVGLIVLGLFGQYIADMIKASISRQREYLADASAVKYTRDTSGIINALLKIMKYNSTLKSPNANTYNHFYFSSNLSLYSKNLFSTHPPIEKRIIRIDPSYEKIIQSIKTNNQKAKEETIKKSKESHEEKRKINKKTLTAVVMLNMLNKSGKITQENIDLARERIQEIPKQLYDLSKNSFTSQALIFAFLAQDENEISQKLVKKLKQMNPNPHEDCVRAIKLLKDLEYENYLTLILMCIPSLKQMSKKQYEIFKQTLLSWIWDNEKIVFFEWIIKRIVLTSLDIHFNIKEAKNKAHSKDFNEEISFFISFLCQLEEKNGAKELFEKLSKHFKSNYRFITQNELDFDKFGKNLDKLVFVSNSTKKQMLEFAIYIFKNDEILSPKNKQMLYALSLVLKIPLSLS